MNGQNGKLLLTSSGFPSRWFHHEHPMGQPISGVLRAVLHRARCAHIPSKEYYSPDRFSQGS